MDRGSSPNGSFVFRESDTGAKSIEPIWTFSGAFCNMISDGKGNSVSSPNKSESRWGYCAHCGHDQLFRSTEIDHPLHLTITVVTFGLWSVSWLSLWIVS